MAWLWLPSRKTSERVSDWSIVVMARSAIVSAATVTAGGPPRAVREPRSRRLPTQASSNLRYRRSWWSETRTPPADTAKCPAVGEALKGTRHRLSHQSRLTAVAFAPRRSFPHVVTLQAEGTPSWIPLVVRRQLPKGLAVRSPAALL